MAWLDNEPIIWYDSDGDGNTDTFLAYNSTGIYSRSGGHVVYHQRKEGYQHWDEEGLRDKLSAMADTLGQGAGKWSYSRAAGGSGDANVPTSSFEGNENGLATDAPTFGDEGFGSGGLTQADFEGLTSTEIAQMLMDRGLVPPGMTLTELEAQVIKDFPQAGGDAYDAGIAEDVYGFETDIARAQEDIGVAGEGARSDIYGLQGQAAQTKRATMFGKGLGGGMSQLAQQDTSQAMRASGQGIMSGLSSKVTGHKRTIEDATTELHGVEQSDGTFLGGIYGIGGSASQDEEFDAGVNTFLEGL